jgi:hypothetical protein
MLRQSYQWDDSYKLYLVPALGDAAFRAWLLDVPNSEEIQG